MAKHAVALARFVLLLSGATCAAPSYSVTTLSPDGTTRWTELNNAGAATGYLGGRAYVRAADGQLTLIPQLSEQPTAITAFGANGAVGLMRTEQGLPQNVQETGLWRNGVVETLPTLRTTPDGLGYGVVNRISGNGLLAGTSAVNGGFYDDYGNLIPYTHAASFSNGQVHDLGTLGGNFSMGYGINDSGTSTASALIWRDGETTSLSLPGYSFSDASAISNRGDVVGRLFAPGQLGQGFLYRDGEIVLLAYLLDQPVWTIREVTDINDNDTILGVGCQGSDCSWVLLTPVPEPTAYGMLGAGLVLLAFAARPQRRSG